MGYAFGFMTRAFLRVMRRFGAGRDQEVALTFAMVRRARLTPLGLCAMGGGNKGHPRGLACCAPLVCLSIEY